MSNPFNKAEKELTIEDLELEERQRYQDEIKRWQEESQLSQVEPRDRMNDE